MTEHSNEIVRRVAKQIARRRGKLDAGLSSPDVIANMQQIAAKLRSDALLVRTATPSTRSAEAKAHSTDWYGLPPLAAACVAIRRLIQAEQQLPAMIDAVIAGTAAPAMSILKPLPAYDDKKLNYKSTGRLNKLLAFYRDEVLADNNDNNWRPWKATGSARDFLVERGTRQLGDHEGSTGDPRRAFYLLDIIPEHRFAIG